MFDLTELRIRSALRGLWAMKGSIRERKNKGVNWTVRIARIGPTGCLIRVAFWTPTWHEGRGPYLSMSLFGLVFYRGY